MLIGNRNLYKLISFTLFSRDFTLPLFSEETTIEMHLHCSFVLTLPPHLSLRVLSSGTEFSFIFINTVLQIYAKGILCKFFS